MSIEVGCEACGARFAAAERWAGKSGKCPQCGGAIVVPQPDANANETLVPVQPDANANEALVPVERAAEQTVEQPVAQPVEQPLAGLLDEELGDGDPLGPPAAGSELLGRGKKAKRKRTTHRSPRKRTDSVWDRNGIMMLVVGAVVLLLVLLYVSLGMYRSAGFYAFWGIGVILMAIPKRNEEIEWIIAKLVGGLLGGAWILLLFWTIGRVWLIIWETGGIPPGFYQFLLDAMFTTVIVLAIIWIIFWLSGRFGFFRIWSWKYVIMLGILPAITFTLAMLPEDGYVPGTRFFRPRSTLAAAPPAPPPASPPRQPLPVAPPRPKTRAPAPLPKPDPAPPRFDMAPHRVPFFPELPTMQVLEPGVLAAEVNLGVADGLPGQADTLYVYLPAGDHRTKSLACVLVASAGSNLLTGVSLGDGDRAEHVPYVRAGLAVVAYELDGPLDDESPEAWRRAYPAFRAAGAGMINARNAIDFVLAKLPRVDPQRLYAAGHSSAGTAALLLAAHDSRIRGCVAYAAAPGVGQLQARAMQELEPPLPDLDDFIRRSSPIEQATRIRCPVLLFHSEADDVVSREETMQLYQAMSRGGGRVSLHKVRQGDHYASMIDEGIPYAIEWLVKSAGAGSSGAVANLPEAVQAPPVVPDAVPWNVPLDPIRAGTVTLGTQPIPLRSSRTEFARAVFSQPETAKAVTLSRSAGSGSARSGDAPFWLDVYDLAASRHSERIGLSSQCQLHAMSPGGTLVLLTIGTQAQVWSLSDQKVLSSWKYAFDTKGEAVWARFGDDDHVAVLGRNGDLVFWEVAACRKLFSLGRVDCATVTAGGRYVVALISRSAMLGGHVCDARSGELCGSLKPSSLASWQAEACAMKPDGTLLAAVGRNRVAAWDMRTGQLVGEADQAPSGRTLGFVGNQLLHVDEQIFQPNTGNVVWRYQIDGMTGAADWAKLDGTPDGRPWITVSRSAQDPVYLVPLEKADAAARAAIAASGLPVPRGSTKITADVILPRAGTGTVPVAPVPHVAAADQGASNSGDAQEYVGKTYVDLIAGDPAGVVERLRWHPGELRPGVGLRWGVAVQWIGEDAGAPVRSELQFAEVTGNVGPGIVAGLSQRMQQGKFGDWPSASGTRRDHVVFLGSGSLAELLDAAQREALDRIVVINLSPKMIGLQRRRDVLMTVRLIDVATGQSQWASPQLRASQMIAAVQAGGNPAAAMAGEVMKEVDARHVLEPMPAMQPEHVAARVAALTKELSDQPAEMLPVLVELRYYQAKGLLDADTAAEMYDRVVGIGQGSLLAGDDEAKRREVLKAWIESK